MSAPGPVAIHLDHGASLQDVARALRLGYTSVMLDGSSLSYEENVRLTRAAVDLAHSVGVPVEGELGTIGDASDLTIEAGTEKRQSLYTDPDQAVDFVRRTGVDSLAVAIGTAHGMYPATLRPKLQLDLLQQIHEAVQIPLVLHGGSDNTDAEVRRAVSLGICKVNISSEMKRAFFQSLRTVLAAQPEAYEPTQLFPQPIEAARSLVKHKMRLFNSAGQATREPGSPDDDRQRAPWQPLEAVAVGAV
jgi:fructose-bisphosphate aldolase class II